MKTHLFFCGDSDTWGAELEGLEGDHARRESLRFSNLVAQDLGKTHHNISKSGACNDWIVKQTVDWFEAGNTCDAAIIQFSEPRRWGYYDKNGVYENMAGQGGWGHLGIKEDQLIAHKAYYESVWSLHLELDNYYKNLFFLSNYLNYKIATEGSYSYLKRPQVIFNTLTKRPKLGQGKYETVKSNSWYDLCKNIAVGEHARLINGERCPLIDRSKFLGGTHPNAQGHRNIADDILRRLS